MEQTLLNSAFMWLQQVQDKPLVRPIELALAVFSVYCVLLGPWDAFTLLCLCALCVAAARLLQSACLQYQLRRLSQQPSLGRTGHRVRHARHAAVALLVAVALQALLSPVTPWLVAEHWHLVVMVPLLALAFQLGGTPRAELDETLVETQTNYAAGAAWGFYLGYLLTIFSEEGSVSFGKRMDDYLCSNKIGEEGQRDTYRERMFVLLPMTRAAILCDKDFKDNDKSVTKEGKLSPVVSSGRNYGETQVCLINHGNQKHRLAMEEATPLRTAALAVEDADADFNEDDFQEFARRFLTTLQSILLNKPAIRAQIELVAIDDSRKLGRTVVERLQALAQLEGEGGRTGQQPAAADPEMTEAEHRRIADELTAAGSVAPRRPEQSSELEFNRTADLATGGLPCLAATGLLNPA